MIKPRMDSYSAKYKKLISQLDLSSLKEQILVMIAEAKSTIRQLDMPQMSSADILLASIMINVFSLTLPLIMRQVYDRILLNSSLGTLALIVCGGIIAILFESVVRYCRTGITNVYAARFEHKTTCDLVGRLLDSRIEDLEKHQNEDYLQAVNAVKMLKYHYSGQVFQNLLDLPFALMFLLAIYIVGGGLVLFPILVAATFLMLVKFCLIRYERALEDCDNAEDQRHKYLVNLLEGLTAVKCSTNEELMLRRYEAHQYKNTHSYHSKVFWKTLPVQFGSFCTQISMFGIVIVGGSLVVSNDLTLGGLTACMLLSSRAIQPLQQFSLFMLLLAESRQLKKKLEIITSLSPPRPKLKPLPRDISGEMTFKDVCFKYESAPNSLLVDGNLSIEKNRMTGITGPSLAGTTTLLYLMMGKIRPQSGTIRLSGLDLAEYDTDRITDFIQYIPRHPVIFKGSILDNVTFHNPQLRPAAKETCSMLGLDPLVASLPMGYESMVDSRHNNQLSSSIIHRLSLARALIRRPRLLLVDKSSSTMDSETEQFFLSIVEKIRPHCTIVMVSQWNMILDKCDSVYELNAGRLFRLERKSTTNLAANRHV